jgi:hypothetical protein
LQVRITNNHSDTLHYVQQLFGIGHVHQERHPNLTRKKATYRFSVSNAKGADFLRLIRPYLRIKAEKVDRILGGKINGRR